MNNYPPAVTEEECRVPLVIGITGHRIYRPADEEYLRGALKQIYHELHQYCPHTPLLVLSSLAQGADQLAVMVALEMREQQNLDISVRAPLPLHARVFAESSSFDQSAVGQQAAKR